MLQNYVYDLMMQLVVESKSCKRIKENYLAAAAGHDECKAFWEKMVKDKESHITELSQLIEKELCS